MLTHVRKVMCVHFQGVHSVEVNVFVSTKNQRTCSGKMFHIYVSRTLYICCSEKTGYRCSVRVFLPGSKIIFLRLKALVRLSGESNNYSQN